MHRKWNSPPNSYPRDCCFRKTSACKGKSPLHPSVLRFSKLRALLKEKVPAILLHCRGRDQDSSHGVVQEPTASQCVPGTWHFPGQHQERHPLYPGLAQSPWLLTSPSRTRQGWPQPLPCKLQGLLMATSGHPQHSWRLPV